MDEYILFSKNGEGSFEVKIPFSNDSLTQVSDLLTREGFLVDREEIERLEAQVSELKSMLLELQKQGEGLSNLMKTILKGLKESKSRPQVTSPEQRAEPNAQESAPPEIPKDKIAMLPSPRTKAFALISRLAKEHMDREFTTEGLTLYEKRVFSLLVKRYEFVRKLRKEGRNIVYRFTDQALERICNEIGGSSPISVRSRVRSKSVEEFLERMKQRYPHFTYIRLGGSPSNRYKLLFADPSVQKSVIGNLGRMFGPTTVKFG